MSELRPCSHCGERKQSVCKTDNRDKDIDHVVWTIVCSCGASFEYTSEEMDREEAIEAYNERPQLERAVEGMRKAEALLLGRTGEDKEEYVDRAMDVLNEALSDLTEGE